MLGDFFRGGLSVISITASPQLYRYPYRTNAEALRGDMKRIGGDIEASLDKMSYNADPDAQYTDYDEE